VGRHGGTDPRGRGETLTLEEFAKLARLAHEHAQAISGKEHRRD